MGPSRRRDYCRMEGPAQSIKKAAVSQMPRWAGGDAAASTKSLDPSMLLEARSMDDFETDLISYLSYQPGVLRPMLSRNPGLGSRIASFLTGTKRILAIGGESGNGKSLLAGELFIRHEDLRDTSLGSRSSRAIPSELAILTYDRTHHLFVERLKKVNGRISLPKGQTLPEARQYVSRIMADVVSFALRRLPSTTLVMVEAPLFGNRGEIALDQLREWSRQLQTLILHSPEMWRRILQQGPRLSEKSGQRPAMLQMRRHLLQPAEADPLAAQAQDRAVRTYWEQWLEGRDGMLVFWDPRDDEGGVASLIRAAKNRRILPDTIYPELLNDYATSVTDHVVKSIPNLELFCAEFVAYSQAPWDW